MLTSSNKIPLLHLKKVLQTHYYLHSSKRLKRWRWSVSFGLCQFILFASLAEIIEARMNMDYMIFILL